MEIKIGKYILPVFLIITSVVMAKRKDYTQEEYNIMARCVNEIVDTLATEIEEKFDMKCIGVGGSMPYEIKVIAVKFRLNREINIEEARELEVRVTERLVEIMNNHQNVRQYLDSYPSDHKNAEISISIYKNNGDRYPNGISLVFQGNGKIFYYDGTETPKVGRREPIQEEDYIDAKKIIDSNPSFLKPIQKEKEKGWFNWLF